MCVLEVFNFLMLAFLRVRSGLATLSIDLNKVLVMKLIGRKRIVFEGIAVTGFSFL